MLLGPRGGSENVWDGGIVTEGLGTEGCRAGLLGGTSGGPHGALVLAGEHREEMRCSGVECQQEGFGEAHGLGVLSGSWATEGMEVGVLREGARDIESPRGDVGKHVGTGLGGAEAEMVGWP